MFWIATAYFHREYSHNVYILGVFMFYCALFSFIFRPLYFHTKRFQINLVIHFGHARSFPKIPRKVQVVKKIHYVSKSIDNFWTSSYFVTLQHISEYFIFPKCILGKIKLNVIEIWSDLVGVCGAIFLNNVCFWPIDNPENTCSQAHLHW